MDIGKKLTNNIYIMESMILSKRMQTAVFTKLNVKVNGKYYTINPFGMAYGRLIVERLGDGLPAPKFGNYFDITSKKKLTYHPCPRKQEIAANGKWKREGRAEIKPAKVLGYIFNMIPEESLLNVLECSVEELPKIKRAVEEEFTKVCTEYTVSDIKISKYPEDVYNTANSVKQSNGTLDDSCMALHQADKYNNDEWRDYFIENDDFYPFYATLRENGVRVETAYTEDDEGYLTARALVWHNVQYPGYPNGFTFMDRIYGTSDSIEKFKTYAKEHGWAYRAYQDHDNNVTLPNGEVDRNPTLTIDLSGGFNSDSAPYMDTFSYLHIKKNHDTLMSVRPEYYNYKRFRETDGTIYE